MRGRSASALVCALVLLAAGCTSAGDDARPSSGPTSSRTTDAAPSQARAPQALPTESPRAADLDADALARFVRAAEDAGSTCLLVLRDGAVVAEHYWRDAGPDDSREVFSVTKSVVSTLVGIAQAEGLLDIDDRASRYIPAWRGTASAAVTIRDLLSNDSGRHWELRDDYVGLIGARNRTRHAIGVGQDAPPGTVWAYNNTAIQTLDAVLVAATGQTTADYAQQVLFEPLGMAHTRMTRDASGRSTTAYAGLRSTCGDLGRFGQTVLDGGELDGVRVVPRAWVQAATGESSQGLNAGYGFLWWLNRSGELRGPVDAVDGTGQPVERRSGQLVPGAPEDLFAALGFGGQVVMVDPTHRIVVVRLGDLADLQGSSDYGFEEAARVLDAVRD